MATISELIRLLERLDDGQGQADPETGQGEPETGQGEPETGQGDPYREQFERLDGLAKQVGELKSYIEQLVNFAPTGKDPTPPAQPAQQTHGVFSYKDIMGK